MITHTGRLRVACRRSSDVARTSACCNPSSGSRQRRSLVVPLWPATSCPRPALAAARASAGVAVVAFASDTDAPEHGLAATASTQTADVHFRVQRNLPFGSHMCVVGDAPELGTWKVKSARAMRWSEGDVWTLSLPLPPGNYNWKHMVQHSGSEEWERGPDRDLVVSTADVRVEVETKWGRAEETVITVTGEDDPSSTTSSNGIEAPPAAQAAGPAAATAADAADAEAAAAPAAGSNGTQGASASHTALLRAFERYQQLVAGALHGAVTDLEAVQRDLEHAGAGSMALSTDAAGAAGAAGAPGGLLGAGAPASQDAAAAARALAGVVQLKVQLLEWQQRSDALLAAADSDVAGAGAADMEEGKAMRLGLMLQRLAASAEAPTGTGQPRKNRRQSATTSSAAAPAPAPLGEELAGQVAPAVTLAGPAAPDITAGDPAAAAAAAAAAERKPVACTARPSTRAKSRVADAVDAPTADAAAAEDGAGGPAKALRRMRRTSRGATSMMSAAGGSEAYVELLLTHRLTEQYFKGLVCCSMLLLGVWRPGFEKLLEGTLLKDVWRAYQEHWGSGYMQAAKKQHTTPAAVLDAAAAGDGAVAASALWAMAQIAESVPEVAEALLEQGAPLAVNTEGSARADTLVECKEMFGMVRAKAVEEGRAMWV